MHMPRSIDDLLPPFLKDDSDPKDVRDLVAPTDSELEFLQAVERLKKTEDFSLFVRKLREEETEDLRDYDMAKDMRRILFLQGGRARILALLGTVANAERLLEDALRAKAAQKAGI
jgi:hypothetical protein